jgi:hypothetical protein
MDASVGVPTRFVEEIVLRRNRYLSNRHPPSLRLALAVLGQGDIGSRLQLGPCVRANRSSRPSCLRGYLIRLSHRENALISVLGKPTPSATAPDCPFAFSVLALPGDGTHRKVAVPGTSSAGCQCHQHCQALLRPNDPVLPRLDRQPHSLAQGLRDTALPDALHKAGQSRSATHPNRLPGRRSSFIQPVPDPLRLAILPPPSSWPASDG